MNILDLLKKYEDDSAIQFLINQFGTTEYINDIFSSTMGLKKIIENRNLDYEFYKIFHNIYMNIQNDKTIDNTLLNCLIIIESYYTIYSKSKQEKDNIKNSRRVFNNEELRIKQNNSILSMYNIDTLPINYKYYNLAKKINYEKRDFSLNEIFNNNIVFDTKEGFNAVSVITPHQTISIINEAKFNNMKGSGYHDDSYENILKVVYGNIFSNNTSGQDIKVRYTTLWKKDGTLLFSMLLEVPFVINSSQKISLQNLNNEIKKIEENLNQDIYINASIIDYDKGTSFENFTDQTNLDNVINGIIINDNKNNKYQELCFIGYSNVENHYNKIHYVR